MKKADEKRFNHEVYLFTALCLFFLFLVVYQALKYEVIYPPAHKNQASPKKYIDQKSKNLPQDQIPKVVENGSREKHQVALTFDADMTPGMLILLQKGAVKSWYNQEIKKTLDKEKVKATIFLGGLWAKTYPKEARDIASDPLLEIGNHSYNHYAFSNNCFRLPVLESSQDKDDVMAAQKVIQEKTGITPKYFRFPGGCYENIDLKTISNLGLTIVHWDVAAGDGFNQNPDSIATGVLSRVQNGSIVVFHIHGGPYAPKTNEALLKIIPELKRRGYSFVTVSEMLNN